MRATSFSEIRSELERLGDAPEVTGTFSYSEILQHCAQSIEFSMSGYPELRSALFRATVGKIAKGKFLRQGFMTHKLDAPVPGAPSLDPSTSVARARQRLLAAMTTLSSFDGELAPHLAFGKCDKSDYEQIHSMHIAEHLTCVS